MNRPRRRSKRQTNAKKSNATGPTPPAHEFDHGFVLVHGIGPTRSGSTLDSIGRPAANLLGELYRDEIRWTDAADVAGQRAAVLEVAVGTATPSRFLMVESRWTDLTAAPRFSPRAMWWTLVSALTLLPYIIGPGAKELTDAEAGVKDIPEGQLPRMRHAPVFASVLGTMLWRVSVFGIIVAFLVQLIQWGLPGWIVAAVLAAGTMVGVALSPTDFAGQVRVIATHPAARKAVLDSIAATAAAAQERCAGVTLVGHSQGGYISYELLRDRGLTRLASTKSLIGIGSGLKPIRILAAMRGRRAITGTFLYSAGAVIALVGAAIAAAQVDFSTWPSFDSTAPTEWMRDLSSWMWGTWLSELPYFGILLAGLAMAIAGMRIRREFNTAITAVPDLPGVRWEEWATAHDIVGRFALPALPARTTSRQAAGSHTLLDHLLSTYFRRGGGSRMFLAQRLIDESRAPQRVKRRWSTTVSLHAAASVAHAGRWYSYRGFVQLSVFVALLGLPLFFGIVDLVGSFARTWPVFLVFGVTSTAIAWWAIRRRARRDDATFRIRITTREPPEVRATELSPPRRRAYWIRFAATLGMFGLSWFAVALTTAAATQTPVLAQAVVPLTLASLLLGTYFSAVAADFAVPAWLSILIPPSAILLNVACGVIAVRAGASVDGSWIGSSMIAAISAVGVSLDIPTAFVRRHQRRVLRRAL